MAKAMLINVTQAEESRVAIVDNGILEWIEIETGGREKLRGNIYKGIVENVNASLQAAFVRFGGPRAGFLPLDEVNFNNVPARRRDAGGRREGSGPNRGSRSRIQDHLQPGQELLVQVVREEFGTKPPTLSTYYSLPGRYLVLLPGTDSEGISRKIEDETGRERLKKILNELSPPDGMGLIVRTAGLGQTKTELTRDLRYLTRLWDQIDRAAKKTKAPALIYQERDLVLRAIRDLYTPDIEEVLIDNEEVHRRAERFFHTITPTKQKLVTLYTGDQPLFARYDLEDQIENIYKRRVPLKSGGAIVIDETEALTSIDVNSGKTREANIEETAYRTNLEAAEEIARQLRLRDIGGLIVIDFIDMRHRNYIRAVEKSLKDAMKADKARYDMTRLSKLGLLEMSRQRLRATTMSSSYTTCVECEGNGVVKTVESAALAMLRRVHTRAARGDLARIKVILPTDIAIYLLNTKREELLKLEQRYHTDIKIVGRLEMWAHEVQFEAEPRTPAEDDRSGRKGLEPRVKHPDQLPEAEAGGGEDRRRRRGGRGGRRRGERGGEAPAESGGTAQAAVSPPPPVAEVPAAAPAVAGPESSGEARTGRRRRSRGGRGRRGRGRGRGASPAGGSPVSPVSDREAAPGPDSFEAPLSGPPDFVTGPEDEEGGTAKSAGARGSRP